MYYAYPWYIPQIIYNSFFESNFYIHTPQKAEKCPDNPLETVRALSLFKNHLIVVVYDFGFGKPDFGILVEELFFL